MKYVFILLIFVGGFFVGRWSVPEIDNIDNKVLRPEVIEQAGAGSDNTLNDNAVNTQNKGGVQSTTSLGESDPNFKLVQNNRFVRTDAKAKDKQVRDIFALLMMANEKGNIEEQNRLFAEMEKLDSKHEKVFEAKTMFLQDDENWEGAYEVLKECINVIPNSLYCLRRLTNIRTSTLDDKLNYGMQCLQVDANDPHCLVDVAIVLNSKGDFIKSKDYFELALRLPARIEGYHKEYILYHYASALEGLRMYQEAKEALTQACRLKMKPACEKLRS